MSKQAGQASVADKVRYAWLVDSRERALSLMARYFNVQAVGRAMPTPPFATPFQQVAPASGPTRPNYSPPPPTPRTAASATTRVKHAARKVRQSQAAGSTRSNRVVVPSHVEGCAQSADYSRVLT